MPKPVKKKRPFISGPSTTFVLQHRSQKDPLAADPDAPQHVLEPVRARVERGQDAGERNEDAAAQKASKKRKEEERQFGVFYDDNYDYLQHLKDRDRVEYDWEEADKFLIESKARSQVKNANRDHAQAGPSTSGASASGAAAESSLQLPSSVFPSAFEEDVGMLNLAAPRSGPRLDWDPDIVETLDDAFQHEQVFTLKDADAADPDEEEGNDELDDFLTQAVHGEDEDDEDCSGVDSDGDMGAAYGRSSDEEGDELASLDGGFSFSGEETKSKFTQYSMSSSVMKRNEQLSLLDDRFEKFFDAYEEVNTGGLDFDEIEGSKPESSAVMKQVMEEFEKERAMKRQPLAEAQGHLAIVGDDDEDDGNADDSDDAQEKVEVPQEKWDCESILSTYSNIYHHPRLISEPSKKIHPIKISGRTGMPKDVLGRGLTAGALRQLDRETGVLDDETCTLASRVSELSVRNKHETSDEKKARKKAFKEYKLERRMERKANTLAFKEEKARQEKIELNNRRNAQGVKLM